MTGTSIDSSVAGQAGSATLDERAGRAPRPGVMERLTSILEAFDGPEHNLLLDEIASCAGLPRSTAFRLLSQMVALDWVHQHATGYSLGKRATQLAGRCTDHASLRAAAAEPLTMLHLRTGGVAHLSVLDGRRAYYLDKVGGAVLTSVPSAIGSRLRADLTASGLALLAAREPEHVDWLLGESRHAPDMPRLHSELARIRRQRGVADLNSSTCELGIRAVAAPIRGPRGVVGAISIARRNAPSADQLAPLAVQAARHTSAVLFPGWMPTGARRAVQTRLRHGAADSS